MNRLKERQLSATSIRRSESLKMNALQFTAWLVIIQVSVVIMYLAITNWL